MTADIMSDALPLDSNDGGRGHGSAGVALGPSAQGRTLAKAAAIRGGPFAGAQMLLPRGVDRL